MELHFPLFVMKLALPLNGPGRPEFIYLPFITFKELKAANVLYIILLPLPVIPIGL